MSPPHIYIPLPTVLWENKKDQGFVFPLFNGKGIANCQARNPRTRKRLVMGDTKWQEMPPSMYQSDWSFMSAMHFETKSLYAGIYGVGVPPGERACKSELCM